MRHSYLLPLVISCGGAPSPGGSPDAGFPPDGTEATDAPMEDAPLVDPSPADESPLQIGIDWPGTFLPRAMTRLPGGGYVIVGQDNTAGSGTSTDGFAVGVSSSGEVLWVHRYGGLYADALLDVTALPGGDVIAVGATNSFDASGFGTEVGYLLRLGANGQVIWSRHGDRTNASQTRLMKLTAVATTPDGAVIAGGNFGTPQDNGQSVVRVHANGSVDWLARIGFDSVESVDDVAVLPDGTILVAGNLAALIGNTFAPFATLTAVEADGLTARWGRLARRSTVGISYSQITPAVTGGALWMFSEMIPSAPPVEIDHIAGDGTLTRGGLSGRVAGLVDTVVGPVILGTDYNGTYAAHWAGLSTSMTAERFEHRLASTDTNDELVARDIVAEPGGGSTALLQHGAQRLLLVRAAPNGDVGMCTAASNTGVVTIADPIPVSPSAPSVGHVASLSLATVTESARSVTVGAADASCPQ
ncbi:MAG: hypothetical protein SFX73_26200 [Kofleriaceae bacterium]|nr:hypothetical protein [Kofleriaceae bacterium]